MSMLTASIAFALETGMKPDGDVMGGAIAEVVEDGTSHLTLDDLNAIASYLMTLTLEDANWRAAFST